MRSSTILPCLQACGKALPAVPASSPSCAGICSGRTPSGTVVLPCTRTVNPRCSAMPVCARFPAPEPTSPKSGTLGITLKAGPVNGRPAGRAEEDNGDAAGDRIRYCAGCLPCTRGIDRHPENCPLFPAYITLLGVPSRIALCPAGTRVINGRVNST